MLHERNLLQDDGFSFDELKPRALINAAARAAHDSPDYSRAIRQDRPGFAPAKAD
jgi:hypothetical protein